MLFQNTTRRPIIFSSCPKFVGKARKAISIHRININPLRGAFLKTFQKPLTSEEERDYLQRYKNNDPEAKNILIERNLRLVAHIVKKYQGLDEDLDDLISIGTIGLIKAISTFDADKGNRLATYAARCIENAIPSQWLLLGE